VGTVKVTLVSKERKLEAELRQRLHQDGHSLVCCETLRDALEVDLVSPPDLLVTDFEKSGGDPAVLKEYKRKLPGTQVLLLTGAPSTPAEKDVLLSGARNFLVKPVDSGQLYGILDVTARTVRKRDLQRALCESKRQSASFENLIGRSETFARSVAVARKVAGSPVSSVMLLGESGTGKELLARAIHYNSSRTGFPFVEVNCAGIPTQLMESEVFGHEKGAFTDAKEGKIGLFEVADGGTIFLDEIGEMPLELQAKLLKFLDTRVFRPVSSSREVSVDVLVIGSTNRKLEQLITEGRFREDLYYRLNVVRIEVPALRDRGDDVLLLAHHFLRELSRKFEKNITDLSSGAQRALIQYSWPGNVRELRNALERAVLLAHGETLTVDDFPMVSCERPVDVVRPLNGSISVQLPDEGVSFSLLEKKIIEAALQKTSGNVTEASRLLGLGRGWVRYRVKKHGIRLDEGTHVEMFS
jgi:DNA-binding NtrC family response regulator